MTTLENLPQELQRKIFDMVFFCKKDQNFYINKELTSFIVSKNKKCKSIKCLGKNICHECNKDVLKFISYMSCRFI